MRAPRDGRRPRAPWWHPALIVVAITLTYSNSFSSPFVFDDRPSIAENAALHQWPHLLRVMSSAPAESPLAGRPLVSLSFGLNYAINGLDVTGYRIVNLALHVACALLLYGLIGRTFRIRPIAELRDRSNDIALASALLWGVHPLNSEVVNYLTQRTESAMALCALTTMYASVRANGSSSPWKWQGLAVVMCALGMACKESMVTVPLLVALYDRIFVFDSWRAMWTNRWSFYGGLASTWLVLVALMWAAPRTSGTGFASADSSTWHYLLNQTVLITQYLKLTVWPRSLVLYYGWSTPTTLAAVLPYAVFVVVLFVAAVVALVRHGRGGFLGAWFFTTLAPASSVVAIASEVGAERRMYLPLAALVVLAVVGGAWLTRRRPVAFAAGMSAVLIALSVATFARTRDYASPVTLARTVVERWPTGAAYFMLGTELARTGSRDEAIAYLRKATDDYPVARFDLGVQLFGAGDFPEAIEQLGRFVRDEPSLTYTTRAYLLLGQALATQSRWSEAIAAYQMYLRTNAGDADTQANLAVAFIAIGRLDDAIEAFRRVAGARSDDVRARQNLARALIDRGAGGDITEALAIARNLRASLPSDPGAHELLGRALERSGDRESARAEFLRALQLDPNYAPAREALARMGR